MSGKESAMEEHEVVSGAAWESARRELLAKEKEFMRARDALSEARRALPWERVEKRYVFDGPNGEEALSDLFAGRRQLVIYHFMFGPDWTEGCKSCSFWADNFDRSVVHLAHRDVTMIAASRAPLPTLEAFKKRLGWSFKWVSSGRTDFNQDYHVSFDPGAAPTTYNYAPKTGTGAELPGLSVFYRDEGGSIFHTYSTYARGLDNFNATYQILDLVPKGRDEANLPYSMAWLRLRDRYDANA
jgi:predicted dithiol-disulfide oxidoreductase (DUF899 family)